jgi:8-oxo-dGTP diphosphatase
MRPTTGRFLFQQRDDKPEIRYPGMLGLFGGQGEGNENFAECVSREVHEEIGNLVPPDGFEKMAEYSAADLYGGTVSGESEGSLVIARGDELPAAH